ncbi:MAG TPA: hypothetical protein VJ875_12570 [Pyrinomonadaceae bacterium]|nr:hypothetical protein [Pyrinomonadaceae bacterium]
MRLDNPFTTRPRYVLITERRAGRIDRLLGFFEHSFLYFLRKIVDVVLRHEDFDSVHEFLGGSRVMGKNHVLFDEMNFEIEFIDRYIVFEVAIKTVGLFNQQDAHG